MSSKHRIVLKVGSSTLCDGTTIHTDQMNALATLIKDLRQYYDVILVSSGAVAIGHTKLCINKNTLQNKQALASIGQPLLIESYRKSFESHQIHIAQLLLAGHDFDSRKSTDFARGTIDALLANNVLPIINENDAIAISEIVFGDNDRLSAYIAYYFGAKLLIILSDIDGYFDKNPHQYDDAKILSLVNHIPQQTLEAQHTPHGQFATGGIVTKLMAADFLLQKGSAMFLSHAHKLHIVRDLLLEHKQTSGTLFCPKDSQGLKGIWNL
ncbi:glutamate 5-kinase [Helicobacter sp. MIT 05-5293]|nr:glutamate 5-kinase [Helicobacter sp. MIT 05-5293]TLD81762.1 glutamate 5-kinase [Helicobacter sp. MIT 05-5293]